MLACYIYKFKLTIPDVMAFTKETRSRKKLLNIGFIWLKTVFRHFLLYLYVSPFRLCRLLLVKNYFKYSIFVC